MSLRSSPAQMLASAPVATTGTHAVLADGFLTEAEFNTAIAAAAFLPLGRPDGDRRRGAVVRPLLSGSDGGTATVKVWRIARIDGPGLRDTRGFLAELLTTLSVTAGTTEYADGTLADGTVYRACDTLSITNTALYAVLETAFGGDSFAAYSPGGNAQGHLLVPDAFGAYGLLFDSIVTGGGGGFNATAEAVT